MKIGFDAKRAFFNNTGLGNYSRFIISGLLAYHPENNYTLISTGINPESELIKSGKATIQNLGSGLNGNIKRTFGYQSGDLEIFHGLSNEIPFFLDKKIKKVVSIHDLLFMRYPAFYPFIDRKIYKFKTEISCKNADLILAISEQTKQDLMHFLNVPEHKIKVHYQSCHPMFWKTQEKEEIDRKLKKYNIQKTYILQVGTLEERKNALLTLQAFSRCKSNKETNLVFLGRRTAYCKTLQNFVIKNNLSEKVQFIYQSDFEDFSFLYQGASLCVYPSLFEGFGIPVLEAMCSGIPVITSQDGCFSEVGADAVLYIDPKNADQLANSIDQVLSDKSLSEKLKNKGLERSKFFEKERLCNELNQIYKSLL